MGSPAPAEREEMVGAAVYAGRSCRPPIDREPPVDVIGAFSRLEIGEIDALARQFRPSDMPLMVRDIDPLIWISPLRRTPSAVSCSCRARSCDDRQRGERDPLTVNGHGLRRNGRRFSLQSGQSFICGWAGPHGGRVWLNRHHSSPQFAAVNFLWMSRIQRKRDFLRTRR